jgi:adenylosuccinate synthase
MVRQNCRLNGVDELYLNKFDCLTLYSKTRLPGIPLVTGYELDRQQIDFMPFSIEETKRVKPVIKYMPFINEGISGIREYEKLPLEVKEIIKFIEEAVGTKVAGIGVGAEREQFVKIP